MCGSMSDSDYSQAYFFLDDYSQKKFKEAEIISLVRRKSVHPKRLFPNSEEDDNEVAHNLSPIVKGMSHSITKRKLIEFGMYL